MMVDREALRKMTTILEELYIYIYNRVDGLQLRDLIVKKNDQSSDLKPPIMARPIRKRLTNN